MKRIGIYTGKIYSDKEYCKNEIGECCICVDPAYPEDEGITKAKERQQIRRMMTCPECYDCEESKKQIK